jgi:hypothetical protein
MAATGQNRRWHVAYGGYPDGWERPFCMTNDPYAAMLAYDSAEPDDRNGEGQPLDPHAVEDSLDDEYAAQ